MGPIAEIAAAAGVRLRERGGLALFDADSARAFLDACAKSGVRVLGIEGFDVAGDAVRPDMNAIADLSPIADPEASVAEAKAFLDGLGTTPLLFDFVLDKLPGA